MTAWKPAPAIARLKDDLIAAYSTDVRGSDYIGVIGDARHSARASDHNPNSRGYVCALDFGVRDERVDDRLIAALVAARDPRIAYIISDGKIIRSYDKPGIPAWTPAPYRGVNPHRTHVHISVRQDPAAYMDERPWRVTLADPPPVPGGAPLREGSRGAVVRLLQAGLRKVFPSYAGKLVVDGIYGAATTSVVREFQRRAGLKPDGIVGAATRAALVKMGVRL